MLGTAGRHHHHIDYHNNLVYNDDRPSYHNCSYDDNPARHHHHGPDNDIVIHDDDCAGDDNLYVGRYDHDFGSFVTHNGPVYNEYGPRDHDHNKPVAVNVSGIRIDNNDPYGHVDHDNIIDTPGYRS